MKIHVDSGHCPAMSSAPKDVLNNCVDRREDALLCAVAIITATFFCQKKNVFTLKELVEYATTNTMNVTTTTSETHA